MAKIKLLVRGVRNPSTIHIRFHHGKIDVSGSTGLLVDPAQWDNRTGNYKNLSSIKSLQKKQLDFERLKLQVLEGYNESYKTGEIIDRQWIENCVKGYYNRPAQEESGKVRNHLIYYTEFTEWWLDEKAPTWKTGKNKYLAKRAIQQYESFLQLWRRFSEAKKIAIKDVGSTKIDTFVTWLEDSEGYAENTIKRHVGRLRFFLNRASGEGIKVATDYQDRVHVGKSEEITKPYLKESEIETIFNLDLAKSPRLDSSRDYLVLSCYSGLRVSDFMNNLSVKNIKDGYIEVKTQKTGTFVKIPIHPKVKSIFDKRFGNLPQKLRDADYNKDIKVVCKKAGLTERVFGSKWDNKIKRHVTGHYPKWQLITSHVGRRSLATLLHGKVSNKVIASVAGWSDDSMVDFYNKTSQTEYADVLAKYWSENK